MLFNSLAFLLFLVTFFTVYWSVKAKYVVVKNTLLLIGSYVFYGFWDWRFLILIVISTLTDYVVGLKISKSNDNNGKHMWLWLSLAVNLGVLGFFKYFNFFASGFSEMLNSIGLQTSFATLQIVLPVGISFYTFQTLSYTIDVYKGRIKPTKNLLQFSTFVSFFPQLVAGPIERAADLLPQFAVSPSFLYKNAVRGLALMVFGFFKKIAVADAISPLIDPVFKNMTAYQNWEIGAAIVGFSIQIYADFSGYSDIAIGLALLFGFRLSTNFRTPYFSKSIQEFWQRWHITLSSWFRDYVYLPLGGNRKGKTRWMVAVLATFGLSGLWHGAAYTFVLFGLWHGLFYLLERFFKVNLPRAFSLLTTFLIVLGGWVLFRLPSLNAVKIFYTQLFSLGEFARPEINRSVVIIACTLLLFLILEIRISPSKNFEVWLFKKSRNMRIAILYLLILWTILFGSYQSGQHFIYFQF